MRYVLFEKTSSDVEFFSVRKNLKNASALAYHLSSKTAMLADDSIGRWHGGTTRKMPWLAVTWKTS